MKKNSSYFISSIASFVVALVLGYYIAGLSGAWVVAILAILETSLSFDNAVVNATVLRNWDSVWRRRFLTYGLPIAVFGMRLVFPVLIVSITAQLGLWEAFELALEKPDDYATALLSAQHEIAAFGGTFLMMVAWQFFLDKEKEEHWLSKVEAFLCKLGKYEVALEAAFTLLSLMLAASLIMGEEKAEFVIAGIWGVICYLVVRALGQVLSGSCAGGKNIVAQGVGGLLYLEVLDASFSFDGVIGAFAISKNLLIIMLGLTVGALWVRALTIYLVEKGTLNQYRYLEHGAFWAIFALAVIMLVSVKYEIPETITGLIGAVFIALSLWSSVRANRREK